MTESEAQQAIARERRELAVLVALPPKPEIG
jgi:hypothetical protein